MRLKRYWIFAFFVLLLAGLLVNWKLTSKPVLSAPPTFQVPVETILAVQNAMPTYIRSIGTVTSPHSIQIRPQIEGILEELFVTDGQMVKKGDLLARIDARELQAIIQQQQAELDNRRAQLNVATLDLKRYQELAKHNAISAQQLDQQQAQVQQLQKAVSAQQATIKEQQVKRSYTRIHAPIDGKVGIINTHAGNLVRPSDTPLFSLVQIHPLLIETAVPQRLLTQLLPLLQKQKLEQITMYAYDKETNQLLATGHLTFIDNQVQKGTGTIRLRAEFSNETASLWPGQSVTTQIELEQLPDATIVPYKAIQQGSQSTYIWQIRGDRAYTVPVTVLQVNQSLAAIQGEVAAGDEVVIDGATRLKEGVEIERTPASLERLKKVAPPVKEEVIEATAPSPIEVNPMTL